MNFCEISKNTFLNRTPLVAASASIYPDEAMLQEEVLKIKTKLYDSNLGDFKAPNGWLMVRTLQKTFWFKTDKNSWRSRGCTDHQDLDGMTSRNYSRLFC